MNRTRSPFPLKNIFTAACLLVATAAGVLLQGCRQKHLDPPPLKEMRVVDVRFLWNQAPDANVEGMSVFFYPENRSDGGRFWRFDIAGEDGGPVELEEGVYTMIAVNNDLPGIRFEQMSELSTAEAVQRTDLASDCLMPSGLLYTSVIRQLSINADGISYVRPEGEYIHSSASQVRCMPDSVSVVFHAILEISAGLDNVRSADATLSGCGGGVALGTMQALQCDMPLKVDMAIDRNRHTVSGSTTGFRHADRVGEYELTVRLRYYGGGLLEKKFNIPASVVNNTADNSVYLIFKNISLPENAPPDPDAVGIGVDMDGWSVIEINLES